MIYLNVVEKLLNKVFKKFSNKKILNEKFPKISFDDQCLNMELINLI